MLSIRLRHALRFIVLLATCSGGCGASALSADESTAADPQTAPGHSHLGYDQVSARVPRQLAPIASAAVARVNIALHHARQLAEQRLCAGQWTPQGSMLFQVGPLIIQPDDRDDAPLSWTYQSYRHPQALSCGDVSRARFFQELSRHLPDWIVVRPGGQATGFRQGLPVAAN